MKKLEIEEKQLRLVRNTYSVGRPLQAEGFRAALVSDLPCHDAGDPVQCLQPGDLAVLPRGWVSTTPVLVAGVDSLLKWLRQPLAEGEGHHGPYQILSCQLGNLREETIHLDNLLYGQHLLPACVVIGHAP